MYNETQKTYKDFYFIYPLIGPSFLKIALSHLKKAPSNANVVILTNTPELLENVDIPCNLIVDNIEKYMDDFDKKKEFILKKYDADDYEIELSRLYNGNRENVERCHGYRYPASINRHAIKWCVDNNITNFAICDAGCLIFHDFDVKLGYFFNKIYHEHDNFICGHPNHMFDEEPDGLFESRFKNFTPYINEIIEKENIELKKISPTYIYATSPITEKEFISGSEKYIKQGSINLDGFLYVFLFKDKDLLDKFYRILNNIMKQLYKDRPDAIDFKNLESYTGPISNCGNVLGADYFFDIVIELFIKYHDVIFSSYYGIIHHYYRLDTDPYLMGKLKWFDLPWIQTKTRREFLEKNKELLMYSYGHKFIDLFGLEEEFNIPDDFNWEEFISYVKIKYNLK